MLCPLIKLWSSRHASHRGQDRTESLYVLYFLVADIKVQCGSPKNDSGVNFPRLPAHVKLYLFLLKMCIFLFCACPCPVSVCAYCVLSFLYLAMNACIRASCTHNELLHANFGHWNSFWRHVFLFKQTHTRVETWVPEIPYEHIVMPFLSTLLYKYTNTHTCMHSRSLCLSLSSSHTQNDTNLPGLFSHALFSLHHEKKKKPCFYHADGFIDHLCGNCFQKSPRFLARWFVYWPPVRPDIFRRKRQPAPPMHSKPQICICARSSFTYAMYASKQANTHTHTCIDGGMHTTCG